MNPKTFLRLMAVILAASALTACFDVDQKVTVDKGAMSYSAEVRIDAKLAAMSDKKGSLCENFSADSSQSVQVQASEAVVGGNVVCKLSAQGPLDKFTQFTPGDKGNSMMKLSRVSEGTWRIDSSFDLKDKAGENANMEGMMQAMLAGRNLSWSVSVPKVVETNGQLSQDSKTVTWSVPVASAYQAKQSFYLVFKTERPWYSFLLDLLDGIQKFFSSLFGGGGKAAAPAATAVPSPAPSPAPTPVPAPETVAPAPASTAPVAAPVPAPAAAAEETGPITASFDCAKANSAQEKMICGDRELARLDIELSADYRKARDAATDAKALQSEQLQWLKSTRKACSDTTCLVEAYKSRLAQLAR